MSVGIRVSAVSVSRTTSLGLPTFGRDSLVLGAYKPDNTTVTGVLAGISRTTLSGDRTYSSAGMTISDTDFTGKVTITAANITFRNCWFRGNPTGPASHFGLLQNINSGATGTTAIDCTFAPDVPHWNWNGIETYQPMTIRRCNFYNVQDGIQMRCASANTPTDITIEQCWVHDLSWWTAAAAGTVHPSDTETHNDCLQHFGGTGTIIRGNYLDARYARGAGFGAGLGHWACTGDPATEPYTSVALNSLANGGPYQSIPNRGSGTEATGRYNYDDLSCLLLDDDLGASSALVVTDNWLRGGVFAVNGGGNANPGGGVNLGQFKRNKFSRDQGSQGSGGNTTQTLNFQGSGTAWSSSTADIPTTGANANVYEDDGAYIQVRY